MEIRDKTTHIVIHTAAWPGDPSVEDIRRVHVEENGWDDIGYHYVIRKDGSIEAGRKEGFIGAHCRDERMNFKSVGICLSGDHDNEAPTGPQMQTLSFLVNRLRRAYSIPIEHVIGHRETGANKTCPGTRVNMDALRNFIAQNNINSVPEADLPKWLQTDEKYTSETDKDGDGINDERDRDEDGIIDEHEEELTDSPTFTENTYMGPGAPRKKFRETDFGRTLLGKNLPGKTIYSVLGAAGSVWAGSWFEPVNRILQQIITGVSPLTQTGVPMELDILTIVLIAAGSILTFLTTRGLVKGVLNELAIEFKEVISAIQKGREASSPGGKTLTDEEQAIIWKEADDIALVVWRRMLRSRILSWLGLDKTLFDQSKS